MTRQGPPHLAEGEHLLLGSHHTAFQHDKVIGHFTIVDKATLENKTIGSAQAQHQAQEGTVVHR